MTGFTDYSAQAAAEFFLSNGVVVPTQPTTTYIALFVSDPTDANTSGEVNNATATWYTRQACTFSRTLGVGTNTGSATFNAVTGSTVTITHWGIYDTNSTTPNSGNLRFYDTLRDVSGNTITKTLNVNDVMVLPVGALTISFV
jgi:hypothetical protein